MNSEELQREGFPPEGEPEDIDGSGAWTVAGYHIHYSPREWFRIKREFRRRKLSAWGVKARVADSANGDGSQYRGNIFARSPVLAVVPFAGFAVLVIGIIVLASGVLF
jgi:hypothetical protein